MIDGGSTPAETSLFLRGPLTEAVNFSPSVTLQTVAESSKHEMNGAQDASQLKDSIESVNRCIQKYIDGYNEWDNTKNLELVNSFGLLEKKLQQYGLLRGSLEQQERAISIKKQQHEIQTANLESVATEIRDILGKSSDVKQENEQEDTASKSEESAKDKEAKGDYVVEITKDLDAFRGAFIQVLRWDELKRGSTREASDILNAELKKHIENINRNIDKLKQAGLTRDDQRAKLLALKERDAKLSKKLASKINEAERLKGLLSDARKRIFGRTVTTKG